ncbi:MAG: hypothetical protein QOI24_2344 [Acidobacteriota bacterium]|jgi:hypothetical protein|nr:hypothetical protein [Acidobacteriota bacterium]
MRFDEVLRTFSEFFEREGIRYSLAGGLALLAWGHARTTNDVDFVVELANAERVQKFAESFGMKRRTPLPVFRTIAIRGMRSGTSISFT